MRLTVRLVVGLAVVVCAGRASGQPEGYVSSADMAKLLGLKRQALSFKKDQAPSIVRLVSGKRRITLVANVEYVSVDGKTWKLSARLVQAGGDIYAPSSLKLRLAKLLGVRLPGAEKSPATLRKGGLP